MSTRTSAEQQEAQGDRAAVVRSYLHKSVELTENLLRENHALEQELQQLRRDNERLRAQLSSSDAVRDLLANIETLERDRSSLQRDSAALAREFAQHAERSAEVEQELTNLASLYVASSQLNGTLVIGRVLKHVCELLEQLIGAQRFVVYLANPDATRGIPVGSRGYDVTQLSSVALEEGALGQVFLTGVPRVQDLPDTQSDAPIAVLPLGFDGQVIGVIAIYGLLPHKRAWAGVDRELFKLLSSQAAGALVAANLYAREPSPRAALRDVFTQLERERLWQLTEADPRGGET